MTTTVRFLPLLLAWLVLLFYGTGTACHAARIQTYVNIHLPSTLYREGGYNHSIHHDFGLSRIASGAHRYQGSMALRVYTAADDLCHLGDAAFNTSYTPPFMLLVDRGSCTFVVKARHAQMAGAAGLLIQDNRCLCADVNQGCNWTADPKHPNATDPGCQQEMPVIADDGSGMDVSIPIVLLKKQDGALITTALTEKKGLNNGAILVDLKWHPSTTVNDEDVHYGMWVDLYDNSSVTLMQQVKPLALALTKDKTTKAHFYPSFQFYNGSASNCLGNTGVSEGDYYCYQTCTNNGRYCYPSHHVPGKKHIYE